MEQQEEINRQLTADIASIRAEIGSLRELKDDVAALKSDLREGNHAIRNHLQTIALNISKLQSASEENQKTSEQRGTTLRSIEKMLNGDDAVDGVFSRLRRIEEREIKRAKFIWGIGMSLSLLILKTAYELIVGIHK
jgi:sensor histidine kinase regulating citrate/malate metabolism